MGPISIILLCGLVAASSIFVDRRFLRKSSSSPDQIAETETVTATEVTQEGVHSRDVTPESVLLQAASSQW